MNRIGELEATIAQLKTNAIAQSATGSITKLTKQPSENAREGDPIRTPVQSIVKPRQPSKGKIAPKNYGVLPSDAIEGLSQTALCDFYGLSWRNLQRDSVRSGFDAIEGYLHQMTGVDWRQGKTAGMKKLYSLNEPDQSSEMPDRTA